MNTVDRIAAAILYEGYLLWPYRRSARKNQQRWTFGGVYPCAYSQAGGGHDPWHIQTQCLVVGEQPSVAVTVRFLHVIERRVARRDAAGHLDYVDALQVGQECYLAWEEATERTVTLADLQLAALEVPRCVVIDIPAGSAEELLTAPNDEVAGVLVRRWQALQAEAVFSFLRALGGTVGRVLIVGCEAGPDSGRDWPQRARGACCARGRHAHPQPHPAGRGHVKLCPLRRRSRGERA
jgi:hypothetical protein